MEISTSVLKLTHIPQPLVINSKKTINIVKALMNEHTHLGRSWKCSLIELAIQISTHVTNILIKGHHLWKIGVHCLCIAVASGSGPWPYESFSSQRLSHTLNRASHCWTWLIIIILPVCEQLFLSVVTQRSSLHSVERSIVWWH